MNSLIPTQLLPAKTWHEHVAPDAITGYQEDRCDGSINRSGAPENMPIKTTYSREKNVAVTQATGGITLKMLLDFQDEIDDLKMDANFRSFGDYRSADLSGLSPSDIQTSKTRGNEVAARTGGNDRFAMVTSRAVEFGMGRMYQMSESTEKLNMRVFADVGEALQWLELSPDTLESIANEAGMHLNLNLQRKVD